ncbi:MAG: peptide chain release factor N(5)-glutamine methyltransferase [Clostridia bacterium]|nr:peptide chain release factor N(5)-glutamine methyltransferase [Clostridia bacterium]
MIIEMTLNQAYMEAVKLLGSYNIENARFEARELLQKVCSLDKNKFILFRNNKIKDSELKEFKWLVLQRINKIPLQYLLGFWEFMGYEFFVGKGVLIPREDTQVVVELLLDKIKQKKNNKNRFKIVDLCSGSGIIATVLSKNIENADIYAIEISKEAYKYLEKNILFHKTKNVNPICDDIFKACDSFEDDSFDFIISNPPYIREDEMYTLEEEVRHEPHIALLAGKDGLDFYRGICKNWKSKLKIGGQIALEIGINMENDVRLIFEQNGFELDTMKKDMNGINRALIFTKCSA